MTGAATPERILVRCPNWLGDVVMSTPGLHALRMAYPNATIVAQLPALLQPLLAGSPDCDEIWPLVPRSAGLAALRGEARRTQRARFDLGLALPESISSALRMRWGGVGRIVGFSRDRLRRSLLHECVPAPAEWGRRRLVSRERFVLGLMSAVGATGCDLRLRLTVTDEEEARFDGVAATHGLSVEGMRRDPPIVLAPGSSFGPSKHWPAESYAELADRFVDRGRRVVLLGGPGDRESVLAVERAMRGTPTVLDGLLDLGGLKVLLRGAGLLVANDAGARHVAAAFGVPSVVFFGPTSLAKTADNLGAIEVLETEHECRPCYRRTCPIDHRCLRSIGVDDAEAASQRVVASASRSDFGASLAGARSCST